MQGQRCLKRTELLLFLMPLLVVAVVVVPVAIAKHVKESRAAAERASYAIEKSRILTRLERERDQTLRNKAELSHRRLDKATRIYLQRDIDTNLKSYRRDIARVRQSTAENPCHETGLGLMAIECY
jgi:hypothetical protein